MNETKESQNTVNYLLQTQVAGQWMTLMRSKFLTEIEAAKKRAMGTGMFQIVKEEIKETREIVG